MRHHQPIFDRIGQRPPTGFDDVAACADGAPALGAVLGIDQHAGNGFGAVFAIQDTDFVIGQMKGSKFGVGGLKRFSQGNIQRIDRAIALRCGVQDFTVHAHLDRRFGKCTASVTMLDIDKKVHQLKGRFVIHFLAFEHHRHRGFCSFKGKTTRFQFFDIVEHGNDFIGIQFQKVLFRLAEQVSAA